MARYAAFLRGINVGGKNIIRMEILDKVFRDLGFLNVKTYIQSGNVLFDSNEKNSGSLEKKLESSLFIILKKNIPIIIRTTIELKKMVQSCPFENFILDDDMKLYVVFLKSKPVQIPAFPLISEKEGLELIGIQNKDAFVISRKTGDRYGFPNTFIEKQFACAATSRNWKTVCGLIK